MKQIGLKRAVILNPIFFSLTLIDKLLLLFLEDCQIT